MKNIFVQLVLLAGILATGLPARLSAQGSCSGPLSVTLAGSQTGSALTASETHMNAACPGYNGSATITATGGTPPYTGTGTFAQLGGTTVQYTVTDASGCMSTVSVTVGVDPDIQSPSILCPVPMEVANVANTCSSSPVVYTTPVGTDNCPGAVTTQTAGLASGSVFPVGVTTNTFEVSDGINPNSSCSFTVTVTSVNGLPINNIEKSTGYCTLPAAVSAADPGNHLTIYTNTYTGCVTIDRTLYVQAIGGAVVIDCLAMNGAGIQLILESNFTINSLTLTSGHVRTNGNNLTVGSISGGNAASYIVTD